MRTFQPSLLDLNKCLWCRVALGSARQVRRDQKFCSKLCRQASWRFDVPRCQARATKPMHFAYADPPYPGKAFLYPEKTEINYPSLIDSLEAHYPDGWALSVSSAGLRDVLTACPRDVRVCAWIKGPRKVKSTRPLVSWEPVIVARGRKLDARHVSDVFDSLVYGGRYRAFPNAIIGMKPPQFAVWMFRQLGAHIGDTLDDLFPGSGAVSVAWRRYAGEENS